jgi:acyl-CoA reductase-like NAD-dependent aldehyde dehydrogenase
LPAQRTGDTTTPMLDGPTSDTLICRDPATRDELGRIPVTSKAEVVATVRRARVAQRAWAKTSFEERRAVLKLVLDAVVRRRDEICRLAVRDSGKTMVDAAMGEIFPVCEKLRYTIRHGERDLKPEARSPGFLAHKRAWVEWHPVGVVGVIAPWNFPFHNLFCPLVPALFAGNAVVTKVSELASWSAATMIEIVHDALRARGHSTDLVQVVYGWGQTGADLVGSGVDKVFFTGSPKNGAAVMREASDTLTPVVLELGGKDPMIVCEDADLTRAADAAMLGVFTACGQMCVGAERIYVHTKVYGEFVEMMRRRVSALRQGKPLGDEIVDCGAMTMPRQLDIVQELVDDAIAKGAKALVGGKRNTAAGPQFFEPTLLVDVDHRMRITQEETFGPVMVIARFGDDEEAVRLANACPFGLGSSVFSANLQRAERIGRELRCGMTVVNDYGIAYMVQSLPFGGVGISGFGRINGREGLRACCYEHAFVNDRVPFGKSIAIHPIHRESYGLVSDAVRILYGADLSDRGRAVWSALQRLRTMARDRSAR